MRLISWLKAIRNYQHKLDLLDEHYNGRKLELKKITTQVVNTWIKYCKRDIKNIDISNDPQVPEVIARPVEPYDYLLKYFYIITHKEIPTKGYTVQTMVRNCPVTFIFKISDDFDSVAGKTTKMKSAQGDLIVHIEIFIPIINIINANLENKSIGTRFQYIEKLVSNISRTINHELTHGFQYINRTAIDSDSYDLKKFYESDFVRIIQFIMYLIESDELEAKFNECYYETKRKGKYFSIKGRKAKTKHKNFVDTLFCNLLERLGEGGFSDSYRAGRISLDTILDKLFLPNLFVIIWVIFCYGLNDSGYKKLIIKDDINNIRSKFNLDIINDNMNRLRTFIAKFHKNEELQTHLIRIFNGMEENVIMSLFLSLFQIDKSNSNGIRIFEEEIESLKRLYSDD